MVGLGRKLGPRVPALIGALVLAGCAAAPGTTPAQTDRAGLQAVVVSTSVWTGDATVLVALSEADATPIGGEGRAVSARFMPPPDAPGAPPVGVDGSFVRPAGGSRDLVRLDVPLPVAGRWSVEVTLRGAANAASPAERRTTTSLTVRDPGRVPTGGAAAPPTATPTLASVGGDVALVTSDSHPVTAFYERSVSDALAAGSPFVLILDSAGFRESEACGSALAIFHGLAGTAPSVTMIHAEPFATRITAGRLTLDPPDGPAALAEWSVAWGLDDPAFGVGSVPWGFVVDDSGIVTAAFQGVMGSEELALALAEVAS
jgi:hypothetical protein